MRIWNMAACHHTAMWPVVSYFWPNEKHQYGGGEVQLDLGSLLPALGARGRGHGFEQTPLP
jgi:hypothetical protein